MACHHVLDQSERNRYLRLVCCSLCSALGELAIGFFTGSSVLVADGLHALSDSLEHLLNAFIAERSRFLEN